MVARIFNTEVLTLDDFLRDTGFKNTASNKHLQSQMMYKIHIQRSH